MVPINCTGRNLLILQEETEATERPSRVNREGPRSDAKKDREKPNRVSLQGRYLPPGRKVRETVTGESDRTRILHEGSEDREGAVGPTSFS